MAHRRPSTSSEIRKQTESLMNCAVCMERFKKPKVLPCQHTFCLSCLRQCYDAAQSSLSARTHSFQCPTCRNVCYVPQGRLDNLPGDFKVSQFQEVLERLEQSRLSSSAIIIACEICQFQGKRVEAVIKCQECKKNFCTECSNQHNNSAVFQKHVTKKIQYEASSTECLDHGEAFGFYCRDCSVAVCNVCVVCSHNNHEVISRESANTYQRDYLKFQLEDLNSKWKEFDEQLSIISRLKQQQTIANETVMADISASASELRKLVHTAEEQLHEELKCIFDQKMSLATKMEDELKQRKQAIDKLKQTILEVTSESDFLSLNCLQNAVRNTLLQTLSSVPESVSKSPKLTLQEADIQIGKLVKDYQKLVPDEELIAKTVTASRTYVKKPMRQENQSKRETVTFTTRLQPEFSSLQIKDEEAVSRSDANKPNDAEEILSRNNYRTSERTTNETRASQRYPLLWEQRDESLTREVTSQQKSDKTRLWQNSSFTASRWPCFLNTDQLVVTDYTDTLSVERIKLFSINGQPMKGFSSGIVVRPWGICFDSSSDSVVITDHGNSAIKIMHLPLSVNDVRAWRNSSVYKPTGIALTQSGQYVLTDSGEFARYRIKIFGKSLSGISLIKEFGTSQDDSDAYLLTPNFVAIDQQDRIVVSDSEDHHVKIFDTNGELLLKFSYSESANESMSPQGVAIDQSNNILVADQATSSVALFSPDGSIIETVCKTDGRPFGIAYEDEEHLLAVATDQGMEVHKL